MCRHGRQGRSSAETAAGRYDVSRILIADDETAVRELIAVLLEDEGHTVQTAPDGLAALAMIANDLPDLLITDVMMPRLDGWTVLAFVRNYAPALPVIVMSAVDRRKVPRRDVSSLDHIVFLRKPFDVETLLTTVDRLTTS